MKFLCVDCDEAMTLREARGPDKGSMSVIFGCPSCGRDIAMLTNSMETQMVRSLGVKIGGRTVPAEPMETVRTSLAHQHEEVAEVAMAPEPVEEKKSESKCPFSSMVADAFEEEIPTTAGIQWTPEAEARVNRIPPFVRSMAKKGIEDYAREQGIAIIDEAVMDHMKGRFGMY